MRGCRGGVSPCAGLGGSPAPPNKEKTEFPSSCAAACNGNGTSALPPGSPIPANPDPSAQHPGGGAFCMGNRTPRLPPHRLKGKTAMAAMGGIHHETTGLHAPGPQPAGALPPPLPAGGMPLQQLPSAPARLLWAGAAGLPPAQNPGQRTGVAPPQPDNLAGGGPARVRAAPADAAQRVRGRGSRLDAGVRPRPVRAVPARDHPAHLPGAGQLRLHP